MKYVIALFVTMFAFAANAKLESHYGKMRWERGNFNCTFTNHGAPKYMKWAVFVTEGLSGDSDTNQRQVSVGRVVDSGETITAESGYMPYRMSWYCKFLERKGYHHAEEPVPY